MRRLTLICGATLGICASGLALAQVVDGLDLGAIQRRAEAASSDAEAFANEVKSRGDALKQEAQDTAAAGEANLQRAAAAAKDDPQSPIDLEAMVKGIGSTHEAGAAPQLIVFVSLSMPPEALKPLLRDVARAGGVAVFQGFPNNSVKAFTAGLSRVIDGQDEVRAVGIDPRLFRAFHVSQVPAIVAVSSDFDLCDGFACTTQVPAHDRLAGNVTLKYALETFAEGHGPGAPVAAAALKRLDAARD